MNTHESYVSLEIAKMLKEVGFDWECNTWIEWTPPFIDPNSGLIERGTDPKYTDPVSKTYPRPTLAVAQRWLREIKGYSIYPTFSGYRIYVLDTNDSAGFSRIYELNSNLTYEEALKAGIEKCLSILLTR